MNYICPCKSLRAKRFSSFPTSISVLPIASPACIGRNISYGSWNRFSTKQPKYSLLGDLFDFWFEYKTVVPKGYVRILGKLATLTDAGIPIQFFVGNHDMWMKNYFEKELSIPVYYEPKIFLRNGRKFLIGHGDGLGPGDGGYKFLKKIFRNKFSQSLFGVLPPAIGVGLRQLFQPQEPDRNTAN